MNFKIRAGFLIAATILILVNCFITVRCRHMKIKRTDLSVFFMESYFYIGAFATRRTNFVSKHYRKRVRLLEEMYDPAFAAAVGRNAEYSVYTYLMLFMPISFLGFSVSGSLTLLVLTAALIAFVCVYFDLWLSSALNDRHNDIQSAFAAMLSKMTLLVNAGVTVSDAFESVAFSSEGILYTEMQSAVDEIKSGISYDEALDNFCSRCGCREVRKFVSMYRQNMYKGGPEFPVLLRQMTEEAFDDRKTRARLAGSAASQKLLLPIILMFVGVLIMVIVPAFGNLFT